MDHGTSKEFNSEITQEDHFNQHDEKYSNENKEILDDCVSNEIIDLKIDDASNSAVGFTKDSKAWSMFERSSLNQNILTDHAAVETNTIPNCLENTKLWYKANETDVIEPCWAYGFSHSVPLINLSTECENYIFYASAHLVIIFDISSNRQKILRGHCNEITCLSCSGDKRWLASGDRGPDSAVIIWDRKTGEAVRTMIKPHKNGVISIELTKDARYLATLSADSVDQVFAIWNWTTGDDKPHCSIKIDSKHSPQTKIIFKPEDYFHLATNGDNQVIFYQWYKTGEIEAYAAPLKDDDFDQKIGTFSYTQYIPEKSIAVTGTSRGLLVVWESDKEPKKVCFYDRLSGTRECRLRNDNAETPYKRAAKLVPLHEKGITFVTVTKCYPSKYCIVTGDSGGQIKFFDTNFMLLYWYQDLNAGPINSISFASTKFSLENDPTNWRFIMYMESKEYPRCSTIPAEKFAVENFVVTTSLAIMIAVTVEKGFLKIILRDNDKDVTGLATHPILTQLVISSYSGLLKVYDYESKNVISMRNFGATNPIQTCCYDKSGVYIGVGFVNGHFRMVNSLTLADVTSEPFTYGRGAITKVDFDPFHLFCAYSDSLFTTTLLRSSFQNTEEPWQYIGRVRVHYRRISDLLFWATKGVNRARLFTLSEDRTLAEYNIYAARKHVLPILGRYRVEQMAVPLCFSIIPTYYKEEFMVISTSSSKTKLFNSSTLMCRKTVCSYPEGIKYTRIASLPQESNATNHFMIFISNERLGIIMLPIDGDPLKSTNIIAHPALPRGKGNADTVAISNNGDYAFTAGGPDSCVHMWKLRPNLLAELIKSSGPVNERFYASLSRDFLEETKDYFYYSMLRTQGIKCLDIRNTSLTIPITEIPFVMRAIGYYPTEEEIENMINEIKYSEFCETGEYRTQIGLDDFIQMYCNHRPYQGILYKDVEKAFNILTKIKDSETGRTLAFRDHREKENDKPKIPPEELFISLQTIGEPISESEMYEYLAVLIGTIPEGGRSESLTELNEHELANSIDSKMPTFLNYQSFVQNILGMNFCSEEKSVHEVGINNNDNNNNNNNNNDNEDNKNIIKQNVSNLLTTNINSTNQNDLVKSTQTEI